MTAPEVVITLLGVLALASALLVVTSPVVVHAALWLVVTLGALAGAYLLLAAPFVAWVQVLIYVGAVVVLLLFAAMLTRAPTEPVAGLSGPHQAVAALAGLATAGALVALVVAAFHGAYMPLRHGLVPAGAAAIGSAVFRGYVLPFEVVSVVLLAALIGAVVLSRREGR
ncbi:MAG: NADH-quinone oxidoreductase subunit J family protein [Mycobacteriales bacterium]